MSTTNGHPTDLELASAFSPQAVREEVFATLQKRIEPIEEIIRKHQKEIAQLKADQNKLVLISRLPQEIFQQIFLYLRFCDTFKSADGKEWYSHTLVFTASHVCSAWRLIALGCHQLWTKPYLGNENCTKLMIERASIPIEIVFDHSEVFTKYRRYKTDANRVRQKTTFDYLPELIPLARTLNISNLSDILFEISFLSTPPEAPFLRHLHLSHLSDSRSTTLRADETLRFVGHLLGERNQSIDSIHMVHKNLFILSNLSPLSVIASLQSLEVELDPDFPCFFDSSGNRPSHVHPDRAILCLRQLPNLRYLGLHNCLSLVKFEDFAEPGSSKDGHQPVNLYNLRTLELTEVPDACAHLMERIKCPQLRRLKVSLINPIYSRGSFNTSSVQDVVSAIPSHILEAKLGCSLELGRPNIETKLQSEPTGLFISNHPLTSRNQLHQLGFSIPLEQILRNFHAVISAIGSSLQLVHLIVSAHPFPWYDQDIWKALGSLTEAQTLSVTRTHPALLQVLASESPSNNEIPAYFPSLRHLSISNWDFSALDQRAPSTTRISDPDQHGAGGVPSLLHCIQSRQSKGLQLDHLEFSNCRGLTKTAVDGFDGICTVSWDGLEF